MRRVLETIARNPVACSFTIALGVGVMLSIAYIDPSQTGAIQMRQALGGALVLLPGIAHRLSREEPEL